LPGQVVSQKAPFKVKDIWALRVHLQIDKRVRELALFNLGIDSKLRGCDLVSLRVKDVCHGDQVASRAMVVQHKTERPVQFEITPATRDAVQKWIKHAGLRSEDFLFPSRVHTSPHLGTRQYARILERWVKELGLDPTHHGVSSCAGGAVRSGGYSTELSAELLETPARSAAPGDVIWSIHEQMLIAFSRFQL